MRAWSAVFVFALVGPISLRLLSPETQGLTQELVTLSGIYALILLAAATVLPSRVKSLTTELGIETVLGSHRLLGLCATFTALAHVVLVVLTEPQNVALLAPYNGPLRALAGVAALLALLALGLTMPWRRTRFERWHGSHVALALFALVAAGAHTVLIGHLARDLAGLLLLVPLALVTLAVLGRRWFLVPFDRRGRFVVSSVNDEAPGVVTLALRPKSGRHHAWQFKPGQFAWLRLERSPLAEEHPFTISSAAQQGTQPEFTIRRVGDWTTGPLRRIHVGSSVWLDGPHGGFTPKDDAPGIVMVAAGIGITPMISILRTLAGHQDARPVLLFLAERPDEFLFKDELEQFEHVLNMARVEIRGMRLTAELFDVNLPRGQELRDALEYFICGNPKLVQDTRKALGELAIPESQVHTELFSLD